MSTILKALRRLEEEGPRTGSSRSKASTSDDAADVSAARDSVGGALLRDRILAEEAAARALEPEPVASKRRYQIGLLATVATVALAVLVFGVNAYLESDGAGRIRIEDPLAPAPTAAPVVVAEGSARRSPANDPTSLSLENVIGAQPSRYADDVTAPSQPTVEPPTPSAPAQASPTPTSPRTPPAESTYSPSQRSPQSPAPRAAPVARPVPTAIAAAAPAPAPAVEAVAPAPPQARLEDAAISPTPAVSAQRTARRIDSLPEARSEASAARAPERAVATDREIVTGPLAAAEPSYADSTANSTARRSGNAASTPTYAESKADKSPAVDRIDQRGLPDVVVMRTSWHPDSSRRSAKIRVVASDETLTLREGDAVGGLVIEEITPSSVLFQAGDVEVRRKVGAKP